jgi:predicted dehydrogenase/acetyltransferase-like isoleucine patch superfamily enzyme
MPVTPNIAVIGSGYWGKNLVRNHHQIGTLKRICDSNETTLEAFRQQYPGVQTSLALTDVLSDAAVEGVAIATPAETHYAIAREALLAGKHVYVEKPLVLDEAEGRHLIDLAKERHMVLMVGHLLHYHPVFERLKEMARAGELGRIDYIYSNRLNLGKIRREENILWSFAPHDISMILALAGEPPETVSATGGYYLHKRIADVTTTHLEFPSGLQAHVFVSWLHPFKEQKLVVVGDRKMAVFDDTRPWADKLLLYPHQINWQNNQPVPVKAAAERVEVAQDEPLKRECLHFLECMGNGQRPVTDGAEGLRVLQVLNLAQRSLDDGGCKIAVSDAGVQVSETEQMVSGVRCQVSETEQMVSGVRCQVSETEQMVSGVRCQVSGIKAKDGSRVFPDTGNRKPETLPSADTGNRKPETLPSADTGNRKPETFFCHSTAVVDEGCQIGAGSKIWHFSHVLSGSRIGENANIGQNVVIGPDVSIGRSCKIQNNVSVFKGVTLEDGVFCGPSMVFTNIYNPRAEIRKMDQVRPTRVKHGATLGANCTIVCGTTIGRYAFVGAGAVVNRNVPDHALVVGNPARQIGWVCQCGERLTDDLECIVCGKKYTKGQEGLKEI